MSQYAKTIFRSEAEDLLSERYFNYSDDFLKSFSIMTKLSSGECSALALINLKVKDKSEILELGEAILQELEDKDTSIISEAEFNQGKAKFFESIKAQE